MAGNQVMHSRKLDMTTVLAKMPRQRSGATGERQMAEKAAEVVTEVIVMALTQCSIT